jgi:hypothetical protein
VNREKQQRAFCRRRLGRYLVTICDRQRRKPRHDRGLFVSTAAIVVIAAVIRCCLLPSGAARNADNMQTIGVC